MITRHPWFGPKRIGWGWRPVSWEGWVATGLVAAVAAGATVAFGHSATSFYIAIGAVAALLLICWLTGTPPG